MLSRLAIHELPLDYFTNASLPQWIQSGTDSKAPADISASAIGTRRNIVVGTAILPITTLLSMSRQRSNLLPFQSVLQTNALSQHFGAAFAVFACVMLKWDTMLKITSREKVNRNGK